jgi:hypothetical protein
MAAKPTFPQDTRAAARIYIPKGVAVIPMRPRSKHPAVSGWRDLRVTLEMVNEVFPPGRAGNIAMLNGAASGNLTDADLDCSQAIQIAPYFLPATGWLFGRPSAPDSHWLYRSQPALDTASEEFTDLNGGVLLELRGDGGLTTLPPSTHPTGERIAWRRFTEPADVPLPDLRRAARELASAVLISKHWPARGTRDRTAMALAGGLARAGWEEEKVSSFIEAVATAAGDEEAEARAKKAAPTARKQEAGEQTTGWTRLAELLQGDGAAVVRRVREWLGITDAAASDLPLPAEPPWPEPLAPEAYYGLAGDVVRALEPETEADPAAILSQFLVAFGNVIDRSRKAVVEGTDHFLNLFAVLVGETSKARKGSSWSRVESLYWAADPDWAGRRIASGLSSGEGLIWHVRDPVMAIDKVKQNGKTTVQEYQADPVESDKRLLIIESEFATVLRQIERQGNTLSTVLRQSWDKGTLRTLVKNNPTKATGACISLLGHITAGELHDLLSSTEAASGFGNRILWLCVQRSKCLPDGGNPVDLTALVTRLKQAIDHARTPGADVMTRDADAAEIWRAVYEELSEGKPGLHGAMTARSEAQALRLACVYALLDLSDVVRAEHLLAALALTDYVDRSVRHVFGDALGDPVADELLRQLRGCPDGLTRTQIRDFYGRHQSGERLARALGLLLKHRLARRELRETGGRPAEYWFATGP